MRRTLAPEALYSVSQYSAHFTTSSHDIPIAQTIQIGPRKELECDYALELLKLIEKQVKSSERSSGGSK